MLRADFIKGLLASAIISPFHVQGKQYCQKIYIHQFFIAGFKHYEGMKLLDEMKVGDTLTLKREPNNEYDENAIMLLWKDRKLGYIPAENNLILANLLDAQDLDLLAEVTHLATDTKPWEHIAVAVSYLKKVKETDTNLPKTITDVKTPKYRTKKKEKEGVELEIDDADKLSIESHEIFQNGDFYEAPIVLLCLADFPERLSEKMKQCDRFLEKVCDEYNNVFYKISTDTRFDFMYEIEHSQLVRAADGETYVRGLFHNPDTKEPIDNRLM